MFERIAPKLQCLEGQGQNSNVLKNKARIPMIGIIRSEF